MDTLEGMRVFVAVVADRSFTAAAERLGLSKALVSKYISQLESRLGTRLLNRSTRTLHLTEAGSAYLERCRRILDEVDELEASLQQGAEQPVGRLLVTAPQTFGERFVTDAATGFLARWPGVSVDLHFSDRYVNVVEEGFDLAIRIGALEDSTLISRRLGVIQLVACASPDYLRIHGTPSSPAELALHECVRDRNLRRGGRWPFDSAGMTEEVDVGGRLVVNGIVASHEATLAGAGIGLLACHLIEADLAAGRLQRVLQPYQSARVPISAVYPHRRYLTPKVQLFVEYLAGRMGDYGLT
jgi:DNA-binding transcriptional LysR family regulator